MALSKRRPGVNISAGTRVHGTSGQLDLDRGFGECYMGKKETNVSASLARMKLTKTDTRFK